MNLSEIYNFDTVRYFNDEQYTILEQTNIDMNHPSIDFKELLTKFNIPFTVDSNASNSEQQYECAHELAYQLIQTQNNTINHRLNEILNIGETIEDEKPNSHTVNRLTRDLILPDKILKQLMSDFTKSHPDDQKSITDNFNQTQASDRAIIKFISNKTNMPIDNNLQLKLYDERIIDSLYRDID